MGVISQTNGMALRHHAVNAKDRSRYIVLELESPNDPKLCTVIDYDMLESDPKAELIEFVNSDLCQKSTNLINCLEHKYFMSDAVHTMYQALKKCIKQVPGDNVLILGPGDKTYKPSEIVGYMKVFADEQAKKAENVQKVANANMSEVSSLQDTIAKQADEINELKEMMKELLKSKKK